jgi:hypothetical protein
MTILFDEYVSASPHVRLGALVARFDVCAEHGHSLG